MAFFLLEGCASRPLPVLSDINFDLSGKIGVRWQADRFSARFRWLQAGDTYQIELWGPLGQGRTVLEGDSRYMRISNAGGAHVSVAARDPRVRVEVVKREGGTTATAAGASSAATC